LIGQPKKQLNRYSSTSNSIDIAVLPQYVHVTNQPTNNQPTNQQPTNQPTTNQPTTNQPASQPTNQPTNDIGYIVSSNTCLLLCKVSK